MFSVFRSLAVGFTAAAVFVGAAGAQPAQALKDAWLATNDDLLALDEDGELVFKFDGQEDPPAFKAIAFERPTFGTLAEAGRGLIAVDGTMVYRFETNTPGVDPKELFDAAGVPALRYVTAVAVTDDGHILISGYSRPKRVFEIWEVEVPEDPNPNDQVVPPPIYTQRASSTPQITDAVYVRPEDVRGEELAGGGLLATAGKQVLFFPRVSDPPAPPFTTVVVLADAKSLALKGSTELTSVDLVKRTQTDLLMIATTERKLLTRSADDPRETVSWNPFTTVVLPPPPTTVPVPNCLTLRTQRLIVRNAQGGDEPSTFVADSACQQLVRYGATGDSPEYATSSAPLTALAIGEGNAIECENTQIEPCEIVSGGAFTARINTTLTTQLLVLQIPDLCDPRVNVACLENIPGDDPVDLDGTLHLNELLPASLQLEVDITIPGYMFSSRHDGQFGVVFIQPDHVSDDAGASILLEIAQLADYELGVDEAPQLPRLPYADPVRVLNQDVAAYAPDNPLWDTVRNFEATPITTGSGSMEADMRGFSAVFYGLVHDVWEPIAGQTSQRADPVGIQTLRPGGLTPGVGDSCNLDLPGSQQFYYPDEEDVDKYFLNLLACLFTDEETLLRDVIPGNYPALESALNQVKDKLIKALSGAGPNTGSETFQAVLSQLDQFDALVRATEFPGLQIYKNELLVRSKVFRFNAQHRAIPSIPIGGF